MGESVAGKIRIDLLANVAQFKAGMREAGRDGFGGFKEEAEKFDRWFASRKHASERMKAEKANWQQAMYGQGGAMYDPKGYGLSTANDPLKTDSALQAHVRLRDALPWGTSMRTTMSREAALTAAAIGEHKGTIVKRLAAASGEIAREAGYATGLGGLVGGIGRFALGHPLITAAALGTGFALSKGRERMELARQTRGESLMLGQGAEDTSTMRGMGFDAMMMTKFQKAISDRGTEQSEAFSKLKLDPVKLGTMPLVDALRQVGDAFEENVKNPADRSSVAMHLFGKSGAEVIATLADMKEKMEYLGGHEVVSAEDVARVHAADEAMKGYSNQLARMGIGYDAVTRTRGRFMEGLLLTASLSSPQDFRKAEKRWEKADYEIGHAKELEDKRIAFGKLLGDQQKQEADRTKAANDRKSALRAVEDTISGLGRGGDETARAEFQGKLHAGGMSPASREYRTKMQTYDESVAWVKGKELQKGLETPEQRLERETAAVTDLYAKKALNEETYSRIRKKYLEDY
jgi:hypothetical protein